jgi:hypothetical protein
VGDAAGRREKVVSVLELIEEEEHESTRIHTNLHESKAR